MGAGHSHGTGSVSDGLFVHRHTVVHRLPAETKLVSLVVFVLVVVSTPREQVWAFGAFAVVLAVVVALARLRPGLVLRRMVIEVPFLVFALLLPFVALGERIDLGPVSVSAPGLLGAFNIVAKGTLGVVAAIVLSATTRPRDLVLGLQRLRVPTLLVTIISFMIRYLDVIVDDMRRMRVAREARGFEARHIGHIPVLARSAGALFVRSYERGERVYLAMVSRGFNGALPMLRARVTVAADWAGAAVLPATAGVIAVVAHSLGDLTAVTLGS